MPSDDPIILEPSMQSAKPMGSDDPIILEPPPEPKVKTTVKPQGWHNWKTVLKQYSTWVLGALATVPDFLFMAFSWAVNFVINSPEGLYAAANAAGMLSDSAMPASITDFIRTVAISGLMLKFIKQQKPAA